MSIKEKAMELVANKMAESFLEASPAMIAPLGLTKQEQFVVTHKALTKALLGHSKSSAHAAIQLVVDEEQWLAMGRVRVGGESTSALATKHVLEKLQNEILKDEACNCSQCQVSQASKEDIAKEFTHSEPEASEPSVNEQTAKEILKEISEEANH